MLHFQTIYSSRFRGGGLMKTYWLLFAVFIVCLVYMGSAIRNAFFGNAPVVLTMFLIGAFIPINWYINQLWSKQFTDFLIDDSTEICEETEITIDETGIRSQATSSQTLVSWSGVGQTYLVGSILIIYCQTNLIMIPLLDCQPSLDPESLKSEFEALSGKTITVLPPLRQRPEPNDQ
jgi:hypothetical protein